MKSLMKSVAACAALIWGVLSAQAGWNDAYRHLEYVETTGSQWIDTGVVPSSTDTIELRVRFAEQANAISWCSRGSSATDRSFSVFTQNGRYRCDRAGTMTETAMTVDVTAPHLVRAVANVYSVDGQTICTQGTGAYTPVGPLVLAAAYSLANGVPSPAVYAKERIYRFRVVNSSGETLHDFWPAQRIEDSVAGLYDTVGGGFVASSSATALVAGPEAYALDESKFAYRSVITFPGKKTACEQQNFPVPVRISSKTISGFSYETTAANGADIRFYDADGILLPHEIELWDDSSDEAESVVWVSVPDFSKTASVTMYWGGKGAEQPALAPSEVWSRAAYVGVWHMGDAENGKIKDSSGHGIDGAVAPGSEAQCVATTADAHVGRATCTSVSISLPSYKSIAPHGKSFQWSCWCRTGDFSGVNNFIVYAKDVWNSVEGWYACLQNNPQNIGTFAHGTTVTTKPIGADASKGSVFLAMVFSTGGNNGECSIITEAGAAWGYAAAKDPPGAWNIHQFSGSVSGTYDELRIRDYTDMSGSGSTYYNPYVGGVQTSWANEECASVKDASYCACTPASAIGAGTLTIETALPNVGTVDPDYTPGFSLPNAGDTRDCTAERYFAYDNKLYACAGYDLRTKTADGWSEPVHVDSLTYTYVQDSVTKRLTWRWEVVGYPLVTKGDNDGVEVCAVSTNGVPAEPVLTKDGVGYYFAGVTYELTPPTNNGYVDCEFLGWVSGMPAGHESDVPLCVTLDAPLTVVGRYRRHGWVLIEEGAELTDGCWRFSVTDDGNGGLTLTQRLAGTHPVLDFTSCPDTTGKRVVGVATSVLSGHSTLAQFTGPDVVALGQTALNSCQALTNVVLSADFSSFSQDSLCNCQNLRSVVPSTFAKLTSIPRGVFWHDFKLSGTLCFPEVTSIGQSAFSGEDANRALMVSALSIIAPKVKTIDSDAFNFCYMVTNLVFSDALEAVGNSVFRNMERLQHFEPFLPKGLKSLGTYTFYWSSVNADKVTIDAPNLTALPTYMFAIARGIREIEISSPINKIGDYALSCLAAGVKVTFAGDKPASLGTKWLSAAAVTKAPWNPTAGEVVKPYASLHVNITKFPAWGSLVTYGRDSAEFAAARADAATGYPGARTAGLADIGGFKSWVVDTTPRGFMIVVE